MKKGIITYDKSAKINYKFRDVLTPCLRALELFLKNINTKISDSLTTIIEYLNIEYGKSKDYNISIDSDYEILNTYPELMKRSINHILSLVNFNNYNQTSLDEETEIEVLDLIRVFTHFEYSFMISLLKIMSREEGIEYVKKMADDIAQSRRDPERYVNSFEELIERYKPNLELWKAQDIVYDIKDDGKMLYKVKKCRWGEILKDLDSEFAYAMNCYGDFKTTKNQNPNFVLTRTKTILMGDDYCDFCYHDSRKDNDMSHPSEIEFKNLG